MRHISRVETIRGKDGIALKKDGETVEFFSFLADDYALANSERARKLLIRKIEEEESAKEKETESCRRGHD